MCDHSSTRTGWPSSSITIPLRMSPVLITPAIPSPITTASRGDRVRSRGPVASSATMSSIRIPISPGRYRPGSMLNTIPAWSGAGEDFSDGGSWVSSPMPWPMPWLNAFG